MPRRRTGDSSQPPPEASVQAALQALRSELRTIRSCQLKMMKALVEMRHELNHRLRVSRDELGALVKASHTEVVGRIDTYEQIADEQAMRIADLERDMDELFEEPT